MVSKPKTLRCLQCGAEVSPLFRPFCSERCKSLDLHGWLAEKYVVPSSSLQTDEPRQVDSQGQEAEDN